MVRGGSRKRPPGGRRPQGTFDVEDDRRVKHTKIGVWDLYEERVSQSWLPSSFPAIEEYLQVFQNVPYVWKMVKDIAGIQGCWLLLTLYVVIDIISSLIPALSLW